MPRHEVALSCRLGDDPVDKDLVGDSRCRGCLRDGIDIADPAQKIEARCHPFRRQRRRRARRRGGDAAAAALPAYLVRLGIAVCDGAALPAGDADGVFETMGTCGRALPLWDRHLQRLRDGAARLGLPWQPPGNLPAAALDLLRSNGHDVSTSRCSARRRVPAG